MKLLGVAREAATVIIAAYFVSLCLQAVGEHRFQAKPLAVGDPYPSSVAGPAVANALVLAVSETCPYSLKSYPFHRRLIDAARLLGLPIKVLVEEGRPSAPGIDLHSWFGAYTSRVRLARLRIDATPTVLLIEDGRVFRRWTGQLSATQEEAVIGRLDGSLHRITKLGAKGALGQDVNFAASEAEAALGRAYVLDLRQRLDVGRFRVPRSLNIPDDELAVRAKLEIPDFSSRVVLDCTVIPEAKCISGGLVLLHLGFNNVWLYDVGANGASCASTPVAGA